MNSLATNSVLRVSCRSRPKRVAYLADPQAISAEDLDKLFAYSINHWGGRLHGIFPVVDGDVLPTWWKALEMLDPDIIVTFAALATECIERIERRILPLRIVGLAERERNECADHSYLPAHGLDLVGVTAIPRQMWVNRGPLQDPVFILFKRRHPVDDKHRIVLRNFGALYDGV